MKLEDILTRDQLISRIQWFHDYLETLYHESVVDRKNKLDTISISNREIVLNEREYENDLVEDQICKLIEMIDGEYYRLFETVVHSQSFM